MQEKKGTIEWEAVYHKHKEKEKQLIQEVRKYFSSFLEAMRQL